MAQKRKLSEADVTDVDSFEDTDLYMDAEGKGAVLGTLEAPDNSKENKKTIAGAAGVEPEEGDAGGVKEDVFADLFDGEGLSETFKSKVKGIFEAELGRRTESITESLKESFQTELEEKVSELTESMSTKVDEYLNYVVENWMEENKLAVETGMRLQIAESFIDDLKGLFENHFIQVPDSKVNLLDDLFEKNEETKKNLDEALNINSELLGALESYRKNEIAHQISEGLTELDKEKFFNLSEEVSFEDEKTYSEKLGGIKESYFKKTKSAPVLTEETETHEPEKVIVEGSDAMSGYLRALERNNR
tara:strand:- start:698 stop:1612 length:915 start_codon:yes stop_codon:yes gene_type:complete